MNAKSLLLFDSHGETLSNSFRYDRTIAPNALEFVELRSPRYTTSRRGGQSFFAGRHRQTEKPFGDAGQRKKMGMIVSI